VALTYYETQTQRLLQNPSASTSLYSITDIDSYINTARGQVAGQGECIRYLANISTVIGQNAYNFSSISTGTSSVTGIGGVVHIRSAMYVSGGGQIWITPRSWEWFQLFNLNNPVPVQGPPATWAQFMQGAAPPGTNAVGVGSIGGSFYIDPPPDNVYQLLLDCVCFPIALLNDMTVEAIPYMWTDAVPFYAAWYALLSSQTTSRRQDAEAYYGYFNQYMQRARMAADPSVNRFQYEQAPDPAALTKMGVQAPRDAGGAQ
jgi:hypothetical protein